MLALALLAVVAFQGSDELVEELRGSDHAEKLAAIEALASAVDHPSPSEQIAAALAGVALEDEDSSLRRASLEALGRRGDAVALAALSELFWALPEPEQVLVTRSLGATPAGRARIWELLGSALERDAVEVPVAELLRVGSTSLAERGGRSFTSAELSPFARLLRSTDPAVSERVLLSVDALLEVLARTSSERALSFLDALEEAGYRADLIADHVCDVGLSLRETETVVVAALSLCDGSFLDADAASQARGFGYLATARFIEGDYERAAARFAEQREVADALARRPLTGRSEFALRSVALQLAATAELGLALTELAGGAKAEDPEVLSAARRAHVFSLRSHAMGVRADQAAFASVDFLFGAHPAPWRALSGDRPLSGLSGQETMRLRRELLAAFATIAPEELPGVTPLRVDGFPRTSKDAERLELVFEVLDAREERLIQRVAGRLGVPPRALGADAEERLRRLFASGEAAPELEAEIERLIQDVRSVRLQRQRSRRVPGLLPAVRRPSTVALSVAVTLREEGRSEDARRMLETFLEDMETDGKLQRYVWAIELAARAETNLGSCLCDEDEAEEAERSFLRAVERLEDLESHFASRGVSPAAYRDITSMRAGALISLAVNANVRLRDVERALAYFERAYELRKDSFATVLLACYRARSGREAEAREALARVVPEPSLYYNLACTHALLGDKARALSFLQQELTINHATRGARERQRAWARDDPDLASLREEPRFQELTRAR